MQYFFTLCLFLFWMVFGSFASVLIHRLKNWEGGIMMGRSHCPHCNTTLQAHDLIPLISYLSTWGTCRYCKKKISPVYPLLEVSTGIVFSLIGIFVVDTSAIMNLNIFAITHMVFFLLIWYITVLYIFYDILFMEIHEGIMGVGIGLAFIGALFQQHTGNFLYTLGSSGVDTIILIGASIVFLGIFYLIMLKELHEAFDIFFLIVLGGIFYFLQSTLEMQSLLSALWWALGIFVFFYIQIFLSRGRALGGWDLRIGIMIGFLLGISYSAIGIILSYIVGSIIGIYILVKDRKKQGPSEVPFGPFLGIWFLLTLLYGPYFYTLLKQELFFV